jgi:hypothetical protein
MTSPGATRTIVLVEGASDQLALEALAVRRGRDLSAEGVDVVAIGGAGNIGRHLEEHVARDVPIAGLCDAGEQEAFRRALQRAGLGPQLRDAGFFVCDADLEDELIRCLGPTRVEEVIAAHGELGRWRTFCNQPFQRGRPVDARLRRFIGAGSGRKIRLAPALVAALDLDRVPVPLDDLLRWTRAPASRRLEHTRGDPLGRLERRPVPDVVERHERRAR